MALSPDEIQRKLDELERQLKEAMEASKAAEADRQFAEFRRVLANLKSRFAVFVEAGIAVAATVLAAIEAAVTDIFRWFT